MQTIKHDFVLSKIKKAMSATFALTLVGGLGTSFSAIAEEEMEEVEAQKILITGSRIQRDEFGSASPIQVLSTDDARKAGVTTISEMLQRISMANGTQIDATINTNSGTANATEPPPAGGVGSVNVGLRGLGAERTLILLNGKRLGASGVRGAPSQPDLSLIPFDLVDRVEVLSDSASAVYGADAVAGVVNVILKESFSDAIFSASVSNPTNDGGDTKQFSFVTGAQGKNSSFVFGFEFYERDRVSGSDRIDCVRRREIDVNSGDTYSYCYNSFPDNAGLTPVSGTTWAFYTPGQSDITNPVTGLPVANWSTSAGVPEPEFGYADFLLDPTGNNRFRLNPNYNDNYDRLRSDLVQPVTRFSLMMSGNYKPEWGKDNSTEVFYDASYFSRHLENRATLEQIFPDVPAFIPMENAQGELLQNPDGSLQMFTNPLNPFGDIMTPIITLDDLNQDRDVELDHFRVGAGVRGDLPFEWSKTKGWNYEVAATYDRGDGAATQPIMNENHAIATLETLRLDADGNVICGVPIRYNGTGFGGIITPTSCVPVNWFADSLYPTNNGVSSGQFATQAERDYMLGERVNRTVVEQTIFSGFMSGDLFSFEHGGMAGIVIGTEFRHDRIDSQVDMLGEKGLIIAENPATEGFTNGSRTVEEYFTEVSLPIIEGAEFADELTLDLAYRFTKESNFGNESTQRVRLTYSPVDTVSLSTAFGTSFRAPNLREQFLGDQFGGVGGGHDPCNAGAFYEGTPGVYNPALDTRNQTTIDNCVAQGADPILLGQFGTTTIPVRTGGNVTDLKPETAEQLTVTLKAAPVDTGSVTFDFAITYFDITIEDTIQALDATFILNRCFSDLPDLASPFCSRVGARDPNLRADLRFPSDVDASFVNIGEQTSVGYDLNTKLGVDLDDVFGAPMKLSWSTQITIQDELTTTVLEDETLFNSGTDDLLETFGNPKYRAVHTLAASQGDFTLVYTGRYVSETDVFIRNPDTSASNCLASNAGESTRIVGAPMVMRDCHAEVAYYSDLSLTWSPVDGDFVATVGVSNLTDKQPAQVSAGLGNDRGGRMVGTGYDQIGRSIFANLSYKF